MKKKELEDYLYIENKNSYYRFGKIISFDTEGYKVPLNNRIYVGFKCGDFFDGENHYYFEEEKEFKEILSNLINEEVKLKENKAKITVIGHNIVFDIRNVGVLEELLKKKEFLGYQLSKEKLIVDDIFYLDFGRIAFLDTFNYFKYGEDTMGKLEGIPKILTKEEYELPSSKWNSLIDEKAKEVVQRDTEILYRHFMNFKKAWGNMIGISIAETSLRVYKARYMPVRLISMPKSHELFIRESYRGGRTESYYIKKELPFLYFDINSLYPYVMATNKYAVSFYREEENYSLNWLEEDVENYSIFALIDYDFSHDYERLPIVVRVKIGNNYKLTQKYSAQDVWLTGKEVLEILKEGGNVKIKKVLLYKQRDLFSRFVYDLYKKREEYKKEAERGDQKAKVMEKFYKLILNSLYGKFGQRIVERIISDDETILSYFEDIEDNITRKNINGLYWTFHGSFATAKLSKSPKSSYPVSISSEITANARLYNWKIQKIFGVENVYMTDTDSFVVNPKASIPLDLIDDTELGKMKREYEKGATIYINAPKNYIVFDKDHKPIEIKRKGIPKNAIEIEDYKFAFKRILSPWELKNVNAIVEVEKVKEVKKMPDKLKYIEKEGGYWGLPLD
mgnify:CR=1 FL=1